MNKPFLPTFCRRIRRIYADTVATPLGDPQIELDVDRCYLSFKFHLDRSRQFDLLYIRASDKEISIDCSPGARDLPICLRDRYNLRWIAIASMQSGLDRASRESIEQFIEAVYDLAQVKQEFLQFFLLNKGQVCPNLSKRN
jgi:hypothetical protein